MKNSETSLIEDFNKRHAAVMLGGKFTILSETINPTTGNADVYFSTVGDIKNLYRNHKVEKHDSDGKVKLVNPTDIWLDHPARRQYKGIVFCPSDNVPVGYFNFWKGFAVEPCQGDCDLYKEHIFSNICDHNQGLFDWLFDWMADGVQNPSRRPGTAVVLRGRQGTGKGVFVSMFGQIFGGHFVHVSGQHRLTGKFNNHLKMALLVFVDEGFWAGDRRDSGTLKAMITEKDMLVEPKFQDAFTLKNHMRVIMASNNDWVVPADLEERRFCVLDVSDRHRVDFEYFKAIVDQMNNGGIEALLYDLLNREITSNLRQIPRTQALFDQIVESMSSLQQWWLSRLHAEKILDSDGWWPEHRPKDEIYENYLEHCRKGRERHPEKDSQFFKKLVGLCPGITSSRIRTEAGRQYSVLFPDVEICRREFQKRVNITIDWEQDEVPF
jgi:hypothetical protein